MGIIPILKIGGDKGWSVTWGKVWSIAGGLHPSTADANHIYEKKIRLISYIYFIFYVYIFYFF